METELGAAGTRVLTALTEARLVTVRSEEGPGILELAHESLILRWGRLAGWLADSTEARRRRRDVEEAARLWIRRGQPDDALWSLRALKSLPESLGPLNAMTEAFLQASKVRIRRRRRALTGALGGLLIVFGVGTQFALEARDSVREAEQDLGRFKVVLHSVGPDPEPMTLRIVPVRPDFKTRVRIVKSGPAIDVESPGGPARFVVHRGTCPPSVLSAPNLPGYQAGVDGPTFSLHIPTCTASARDTVLIFGGTSFHAELQHPDFPAVKPWTEITLPSFRIDRFEVTNRRYEIFARNHALTGWAVPQYPTGMPELAHADRPDRPVTWVSFEAARAFCRFHGGRLPTQHEWEKAARGGVMLAEGLKNPEPKRLFPWGVQPGDGFANLRGDEGHGLGALAVTETLRDISPYGIVGLAGNVLEWTSTTTGAFQMVKGGNWDFETGKYVHSISFPNRRLPSAKFFNLGFRCAYPER